MAVESVSAQVEVGASRGSGKSDVPHVRISGRNRGIKHIDLNCVMPCKKDLQLLRFVTHLDLSHNALEALANLQPLSELQVLDVSYNKISKVQSLPPSLTTVNMEHNRVETLEGLCSLVKLRELNVCFNRLTSVTGWNPRRSVLEVLNASDNRIQHLEGLQDFATLRVLSMKNNLIEEPSELHFLSSCGALESVSFSGNPVTRTRLYRSLIQKLQPSISLIDGAAVSSVEFSRTKGEGMPKTSTAPCRYPAGRVPIARHPGSLHQISDAVQRRDGGGVRVGGGTDAKEAIPSPRSSGMWSARTVRDNVHPRGDISADNRERDSFSSEPGPSLPPTAWAAVPSSSMDEEGYARAFQNAVTGAQEESVARTVEPSHPYTVPEVWRGNEARLATHSVTAQLHDALVAKEQLERDNQALTVRLETARVEARESRRVMAEQLGLISRLRVERDALETNARELAEQVERLKRNAKALENHHRTEIVNIQRLHERERAVLGAQGKGDTREVHTISPPQRSVDSTRSTERQGVLRSAARSAATTEAPVAHYEAAGPPPGTDPIPDFTSSSGLRESRDVVQRVAEVLARERNRNR